MTIPSLGRGGLPVYSPASSTTTATNGLRTVTFTGTALQSINSTTNAIEYAVGVGDIFVVQGVSAKVIESIDSPTQLTLCEPWTAATQAAVANWYIIRNSVPAYGATAKAIQDVLAIGGDASPNASYAVDDGTGRIKLRSNSGDPQIATGPTGTADGALHGAIQITEAGAAAGLPAGSVQFPFGVKVPVSGFRNRLVNGDFSIWQRTFPLTPASGTYTADRWLIGYSTPTPTITKVAAPTGFRSQQAANITVTGATAGSFLDFSNRFESGEVADLDTQAVTISFDFSGTTTLGSLTGQVFLFGNTALDNGTFSTVLASSVFAIPVGSKKIVVSFSGAQTIGLKNGGAAAIRLLQSAATGNWNISVGSVQFEKGLVANDFEYRPPALELYLCQRTLEVGNMEFHGQATSGVGFATRIPFQTPKRVTPTMVQIDRGGAINFGATPGLDTGVGVPTQREFYSYRIATGTGGAQYSELWSAIAEL